MNDSRPDSLLPVRHPRFIGVDMATRKQLIAHQLEVDRICERIGTDSLAYLSLSGLLETVQEGYPKDGTLPSLFFRPISHFASR